MIDLRTRIDQARADLEAAESTVRAAGAARREADARVEALRSSVDLDDVDDLDRAETQARLAARRVDLAVNAASLARLVLAEAQATEAERLQADAAAEADRLTADVVATYDHLCETADRLADALRRAGQPRIILTLVIGRVLNGLL